MKKLHPMWEDATNELINKLETKGMHFDNLNAIELFGRDGSWQTKLFAKKVKTLEVWEINKEFEKQLRENLPNSKVKIIDSIKTLQENENFRTFDLILIDNPNNTYGPCDNISVNGKYCEHFDILKNIGKLIDKKAIIIFNVNRKPFNYSKFSEWKKRRNEFYGKVDAGDLSIEDLKTFYEDFFKKMGFETIFHVDVVRVFFEGIDTNHYFAFLLRR